MRAYDRVFNTNCNGYTIQILIIVQSSYTQKYTVYFLLCLWFKGHYKKWYILLCYRQPRMEEISERSRGPNLRSKAPPFLVFKQKDQSNLY